VEAELPEKRLLLAVSAPLLKVMRAPPKPLAELLEKVLLLTARVPPLL